MLKNPYRGNSILILTEMRENLTASQAKQENPFSNPPEIEEGKISSMINNPVTNSNDNTNQSNNNATPNNDTDNTNKMNEDNCENTNIQSTETNTKGISNNISSAKNMNRIKSTSKPTITTRKPNITTNQGPSSKPKQDSNQSKTKALSSKPSSTNHIRPKTNTSGKKQPAGRRDSIPGKGPKVLQSQTLKSGNRRTSVDTKCHQDKIGQDKTRASGYRGGGKINPTNVSVNELEKILGVNVAELREVIKKFKIEETTCTTGNSLGQKEVVQGNLGSPGTTEDSMVDQQRSRQSPKNESAQQKKETRDKGKKNMSYMKCTGRPKSSRITLFILQMKSLVTAE